MIPGDVGATKMGDLSCLKVVMEPRKGDCSWDMLEIEPTNIERERERVGEKKWNNDKYGPSASGHFFTWLVRHS